MSGPQFSDDAKAFEAALRDNPDDHAGWCAYADYLAEQGDPRGEFMQVQLALEDDTRPKAEREVLKEREAALLAKHEREWLGELAPFALDEKKGDEYTTGVDPRWEREFVSGLVVERLSTALAQALAGAHAGRLVLELHVHDTMHNYYGEAIPDQPASRVPTPPGVHRHSELFELIGSRLFDSLRVFRMGGEEPAEDSWCDCHVYTPGIEHVIASLPRVEELHLLCKGYESAAVFALPNFTNLRVLRVYHLNDSGLPGSRYEYALDVLAANPALANLTHLQFHPHFAQEGYEGTTASYLPLAQVQALLRSPHLTKLTHLQLRLSDMGDDGVRELIASGILKRLVWLDLRHGCVTDDGARLLAACPDAKRLERIDLSRNAVSGGGLTAMRKAGVNAVATKPLTPTELDERQYLREGDFE